MAAVGACCSLGVTNLAGHHSSKVNSTSPQGFRSSCSHLQPRLSPLSSSRNIQVRRIAGRRNLTQCAASGSAEYVEDTSFRIEKISFGAILTPVGLGLLSYGFGAFFGLLPGQDFSPLLCVYGFPITLLGFALSYAQLRPVPCKTTREALNLRDTQMTDIQKQLREDVTRFRYGDEQHLDEALTRIFTFNRPGGIARRLTPILTGLREEVVDGNYALVLEFSTKKEMSEDMWTSREDKIAKFFGPGITVKFSPTADGMDVSLVSDGSGAGRGGAEKKDVLPPLMPGMKARQQS